MCTVVVRAALVAVLTWNEALDVYVSNVTLRRVHEAIVAE
jgi:hypothetical protein